MSFRTWFSAIAAFFLCFVQLNVWAQEPGQKPALAYDSQNQRYLMVWEEVVGDASTIKGKLLDKNGADLDGEIHVLTPERSVQGCFYENFSRDFPGLTEPVRCPRNSNPAVAYNNGTFLLVWENAGEADFPEEASHGENEFSGIFARLLNADNLQAIGNLGEEGVLVSKVQIAANNAVQCPSGNYVCSNNEIQAWGQAANPHVAPRLGSDGFIVTWETNKDYIGCANPERRGALSVYGRYIDPLFSPTGTDNPSYFALYTDDSTLENSCAALENVDSAANARVAFNATTNSFVVVYERYRANGGASSVGAKQVMVSGREAQVSGGAMMSGTLAELEQGSLQNPEVISFNNSYVLFAESPDGLRAKFFQSNAIENSLPSLLDLNASSPKLPTAATNLGIGGQGPTVDDAEARILLSYQEGSNLFSVVLDGNLNAVAEPSNFSQGVANNARSSQVSSDLGDFMVVWQGDEGGDKVFATFIDVTGDVPPPPGEPPTQPQPQSPDNALVLPPVRAYLSWTESTDPEGGNVTYNLYIGKEALPVEPQVTEITDLNYVIGPETEAETGLSLRANTDYLWQIEAVDQGGMSALSPVQSFSTDDSVVAWWRFDSDPNGATCPGGSGGETVCDYSGNNHHGTPMGNPLWIAPGMPDILGGALQFDGVDDYVVVGNHNQLNLDSMSVIIVFDSVTNTGEQKLVDKRQAGLGAGYNLRIQGDNFPLNIVWVIEDNDTEYFLVADAAVQFEARYQMVATYQDSSGASDLYINGQLEMHDEFGVLDRSMKSSMDLILGDSAFGPQPTTTNFEGYIEEVLLMDRALINEEVDMQYEGVF